MQSDNPGAPEPVQKSPNAGWRGWRRTGRRLRVGGILLVRRTAAPSLAARLPGSAISTSSMIPHWFAEAVVAANRAMSGLVEPGWAGRCVEGCDDSMSRFHVTIPCDDPPAIREARLLTGSNADAEELVQDTFRSIAQAIDAVQAPTRYLRATPVNVCRNWHRSNMR
jgi:hypothetical protein